MRQTYTLHKNALRGAKRKGLAAKHVKALPGGGYYLAGFWVARAQKPARRSRPAVAPKPRRQRREWPREGSKNHLLLDLLMREGGASMSQLMSALEWKGPTVRCALQRVTRRYGLTWSHTPATEDGWPSRWFAARRQPAL